MENHLYGYAGGGSGASFTNLYSSGQTVNSEISGDTSYLLDASSRYLSMDSLASSIVSSSLLYDPKSYTVRIPGITIPTHSYRPLGVDVGSTAVSLDSIHSGLKRISSDYLIDKRPRYEGTSHLPIYPQRHGEKDCEYYMQTRTCKFGDSCRFHHPIWVPEGGAPNWKEVPVMPIESLPERPGELDCPYFMKTKRCKFGARCKFNHPKDLLKQANTVSGNFSSSLPERPSEPPCAFYMKSGECKFGATCKFDHPKDVRPQSDGDENGTYMQYKETGEVKPAQQPASPALMHNSKGLPIRLGEEDCPFYIKTGSCKFGATCRFNHPDIYAALTPNLLPSSSTHFGVPTASILPNFDPRLSLTMKNLHGLVPAIYPQRPGQLECDYFMKTGTCKFGSTCKFHHPLEPSACSASFTEYQAENVKLSLAGLPRREGAVHCPFYMKSGICKYGVACKFDHPPPGEVIACTTTSKSSTGA